MPGWNLSPMLMVYAGNSGSPPAQEWKIQTRDNSLVVVDTATDASPDGWTLTPDGSFPPTVEIVTPAALPANTPSVFDYVATYYKQTPTFHPEMGSDRYDFYTVRFYVTDTAPVAHFSINGVAMPAGQQQDEEGDFSFDASASTAGSRQVEDITNVATVYLVPASITSYAWVFTKLFPSSTVFDTASTVTHSQSELDSNSYTALLTITNSFGTTDTETGSYRVPEQIIGTWLDNVGWMFSAVNDGQDVQVSAFPNGAGSRQLLAVIEDAKNPSIYKNFRNQLFLSYQERGTDITKVVFSLDNGRTFA